MTRPLTRNRVFVLLAVLVLLATAIPTITAAAPPGQGTIPYRVVPGDTLYSIARRYNTTVPAIMAANGLTSDYIFVGQLLNIPVGQQVGTGTPTLTPNPTLTGTPTPTRNPAFACTYTVQPRDTVYSIAYRYRVTINDLMQANHLYSPYIRVGQVLAVPCTTPVPSPWISYVVKQGDTLFRIALTYRTSVYALAIINHIPCPNLIFVGQTLLVPSGYQTPPLTPTATGTVTPGTPTPTPTGTLTSTAVDCSGNCTVFIRNLAFVPQTFTVSVNSLVTWINIDTVAHTITSGPVGAPDGIFQSGALATNQQYSFRFVNAGTFPYFDPTYGTQMVGTINVVQ